MEVVTRVEVLLPRLTILHKATTHRSSFLLNRRRCPLLKNRLHQSLLRSSQHPNLPKNSYRLNRSRSWLLTRKPRVSFSFISSSCLAYIVLLAELASSLGIDELHLQDAYLKFQEVDADHSGTISFEELKILLHVTVAKALHDDVLDRYAHVEFSSVDSDHNGEISFQEFLVVRSFASTALPDL